MHLVCPASRGHGGLLWLSWGLSCCLPSPRHWKVDSEAAKERPRAHLFCGKPATTFTSESENRNGLALAPDFTGILSKQDVGLQGSCFFLISWADYY